MTRDVAIVGAGAAGAGAAFALRDADVNVTVVEKSRGVCGRAATRRRQGCTYDHGANYLSPDGDRVRELVTETLDTTGLVDVSGPVWTFDGTGTVSESETDAVDGPKWTYEAGITQLAKRLFARTDATILYETRVARPIREGDGWRLRADDGSDVGQFDALLLTPPAPQTADLLGAANWELALKRDLREAIAVVPFRTTITAVLHYPFEFEAPYYALENGDRDHDVWWISREDCKPGHVPDGESLLIVQLSPDWSVDHYDVPEPALTDAVADLVGDLLAEPDLANPDWKDAQHWRYAVPEDGADERALARARGYDLHFAGDWVAGEGRVDSALVSGLEAGDRIARD